MGKDIPSVCTEHDESMRGSDTLVNNDSAIIQLDGNASIFSTSESEDEWDNDEGDSELITSNYDNVPNVSVVESLAEEAESDEEY